MKLDRPLIQRFLAYSLKKGNTTKHVREQQKALLFLASGLRGHDLIGCPFQLLHTLVFRHHMRTATLKALYGYLRKVTNELEASQDPTLHRLLVPQRRPSLVDKSVDRRQVNRAIRAIREPWKSRLILQADTGIHTTELIRFARAGEVVPYAGQPGAVAVLRVPHKNGTAHRIALGRPLYRAARRVKEAGSFTAQYYHRHVKEAGGFTPGRLRHSMATRLVNSGVDFHTVADFLGHRSPLTTRRWYAKCGVPKNPLLGARRGRR